MKKTKWVVLAMAIVFLYSIPVAFAADKTDIEQKWLDFESAVKTQQVKDGEITQKEADAYLEKLESKLNEDGDAVYARHKEMQCKGGRMMREAIAQYAKLTGRSEEDVLKLCEESKISVFELAQKENKLTEFAQALTEAAKEHLSQLVKEGKMTQEQMDEKLEQMKSGLENLKKSSQ